MPLSIESARRSHAPARRRSRAGGGRPYVVGGAVRDALLGLEVEDQDYDVEVFSLPADRLEAVLARRGRVDAVGQAFRVYKLSGVEGVAGAVDVSLPRRDSKVGPGHRGIAVEGDPSLSIEEASRRRDFTMNAMLWDPATGRAPRPLGRPARPRGPAPAGRGRAHLRRGPAARAARRPARRALRARRWTPATAALCAVHAARRAARGARLRRDREAPAAGASAVARASRS